MKIVMLCGTAGVGKDTYAKENYPFNGGWWSEAFAGRLKQLAKEYGWDGIKDGPGRELLQELGEVFNRYDREKDNEPIWSKLVVDGIKSTHHESYGSTSKWIITDARHDHEIEYIKNAFPDAEIEVLQLVRSFRSDLSDSQKKHVSEQPISDHLIDRVIDLDKCHICGDASDVTKCDTCGKPVCSDSEKCSEVLNYGDHLVCKTCLSTQEKCICSTCVQDECPNGREFTYYYDCPDYYDQELEAIVNETHSDDMYEEVE